MMLVYTSNILFNIIFEAVLCLLGYIELVSIIQNMSCG